MCSSCTGEVQAVTQISGWYHLEVYECVRTLCNVRMPYLVFGSIYIYMHIFRDDFVCVLAVNQLLIVPPPPESWYLAAPGTRYESKIQ